MAFFWILKRGFISWITSQNIQGLQIFAILASFLWGNLKQLMWPMKEHKFISAGLSWKTSDTAQNINKAHPPWLAGKKQENIFLLIKVLPTNFHVDKNWNTPTANSPNTECLHLKHVSVLESEIDYLGKKCHVTSDCKLAPLRILVTQVSVLHVVSSHVTVPGVPWWDLYFKAQYLMYG